MWARPKPTQRIHGRSGLERHIDTLLFGILGVKRKVVSTRAALRYADERLMLSTATT